jgi:glycosyltransferase involved in cell wall biosynthesis
MSEKSQPKKVLILMPQLFIGGSEKQVRYIAEGLEKAKIPTTILVENGTGEDMQEKAYIQSNPGLHFVFLGMKILKNEDKTKSNKLKSLRALYRWLMKNGHGYQWVMFTNLTGLTCVPACKLLKLKVLFNERNPGIKMCDSSWKRLLLKKCNKIVANSNSAASYMTRVLQRKVEVINNGVVEKTVKENTELDHSSRIKILSPARINPVKNQLVLLRAVNELVHNYAVKEGIDISCVFAGQIEDEAYYDSLIEYIENNDLKDIVTLPGYVSDMDQLYANSTVVILSSREEGTPNVILESALRRKRFLASNIIMNSDVVQDTRLLFAVDDSHQLAEKIEWVSSLSDAEIEKILDKEYAYVKEHYSLTAMQKRYIDIFNT